MVEVKTTQRLGEDLQTAERLAQDSAGIKDFSFQPLNYEPQLEYPARKKTFIETLSAARKGEVPPELVERVKFIEALNRLDRYVEANLSAEKRILRDHQVDVFEDLRNALEQGISAGYIKLPTGAGKTAIFCELAETLGLKTLVVVPTTDLLTQTRDQMRRFAETIPESQIGLWYGDQKDTQKQINITTYNSMIACFKNGQWKADDFDLVILDEAHNALGRGSSAVISELKESSIVIGFTATPEYHDNKTLDQLLDERIHSLDTVAAIRRGILAPSSSLAVYINTDLSHVKLTTDGGYNEQELQRAINTESVNQAAVKTMQSLFSDKKGIAFCAGIQHSEDLAALMQKQGIKADFVHGADPHREEKLKKLKSGEIQVLCNADLLIAGFDCPSVSVCLNLAPTSSKVRAEQRGGRATRLDPEDPKKHAIVVDFLYADSRAQSRPVIYSDILNGQAVVTASEETLSVNRPEWLVERMPQLKAEGIEVILTMDELARVLPNFGKEKQRENLSEIPEGWTTRDAICRQLHITGGKFETVLESMGDKIDELKMECRIKGRARTLYHENLLTELKDFLKPAEMAPEGWNTLISLRVSYDLSREAANKLISDISKKVPDAIRQYRSKDTYNIATHISPEAISEIRNLLGRSAPKDWMVLKLNRQSAFQEDKRTCEIFDQLVSEGTEHGYFKKGKSESLHVPQSVYQELQRRFRDLYSIKALAAELGIPEGLCTGTVLAHRNKHPEYFRQEYPWGDRNPTLQERQMISQLTGIDGPSQFTSKTHLTTVGFAKLRNSICSSMKAPDKWKTVGEIAQDDRRFSNFQRVEIEREIKKLFDSGELGPEHKREYISRRGPIQEHYSPEFEALLSAKLINN